jgi:amidase
MTDWQSRAADKRSRIASSIPSEWNIPSTIPDDKATFDYPSTSGVLSAQELELTGLSATELVQKLSNGEVKSVDITLAFCKRAAVAQALTNCVHEFFPESALKQAKDLDDYFEKNGKVVGPLHGLPISLKDQLRVKVCLLKSSDERRGADWTSG